MWCDDIALRQKARGRGVPSLSLLDLITVLARDMPLDQPAAFRRLAAHYVADIPLKADDTIAIAEAAS